MSSGYAEPSYPPAGGSESYGSGASGGADVAIYVGNLPFDVAEDEIRQMFGTYGEVARVSLPIDRYALSDFLCWFQSILRCLFDL